MASETTNYKLVKPDPEEFYDVGVQNSNMDKIDTILKDLEDNKADNTALINLSQTISTLEQNFNEHLADFVSVNQFGTDKNSTTIQSALNYAKSVGGVEILVPSGEYVIYEPLKIPSNTKIRGLGEVIFKRNANITSILINDSDGTVGGYDANENIVIENITFDANGTEFPSNVSALAFGHMTNLTLRNVTIMNTFGWHCVELNSSQHILIEDCTFDGLVAGSGNEMLQLDIAYSSGTFPWFGPWDYTPCKHVTIRNCVFKNGLCGIGSHTAEEGYKHTFITIYDNKFMNLSEECVKVYNWEKVTIRDNDMDSGYHGIHVNNPYLCYDYLIDNNRINKPSARGIHIARNTQIAKITNNNVFEAGTHGITCNEQTNILIEGNTVRNCGEAGIWSYGSDQVRIDNNYSFENDKKGTGFRYDIMVGHNTNKSVQKTQVTNNTAGIISIFNTNLTIVKNNFVTTLRDDGSNTNINKTGNFVDGTWNEA